MKAWALLVLAVAAITSTTALAEEKDKLHKKDVGLGHKKHMEEIEEKLRNLLELEEELDSEIAEIEEERIHEEEAAAALEEEPEPEADEEDEEEEEEEDDEDLYAQDEYDMRDPCEDMYCGAGRECTFNDDREAECTCVNTCAEELDSRRRVCSNHNETWMSDCELYRQRCLCEDGDASCRNDDYAHVHIDYYGQCQQLPECEKTELDDFPRRMSEWLFNIMRDMADRSTLSKHYLELEKEAEEDTSKQWTNAVVWKWCELDSHPRDRTVSRHELFPIRAPLVTLEHCIGTFLDSCDPDDDHYITLNEWAACTKLTEENINELENLCEDIRDDDDE